MPPYGGLKDRCIQTHWIRFRNSGTHRAFQANRQIERKSVLTSFVVSIVRTCTRLAPLTVVLSLILAVGAGFYTARPFTFNTRINTLISPDLDWLQRDQAFEKAFDQDRMILAVVEAPSPEFASTAAAELLKKLSTDTKHFDYVRSLAWGRAF